MSQPENLFQLLAGRGSILLDFDGPVCSIFAQHPAPKVADSLRTVVRDAGGEIAPELVSEPDPLEVLRWTARLGRPDIVRLVETRLCAEEYAASKTARPTLYGREVIVGAYEAGKPIAIVSNNSSGAITSYVSRQRLSAYASHVSGRTFARPDLMKPNPEPILRAAKSVDSSPADCVLIGDSLADIHGAQAAGLPVIGYANRNEKVDLFTEAGADVIVTTMADVARALIELKL
ncbi:MAG TPA: HAD-IA family hydrolase [Actinocrinis sp.]|uniref:HAD family hydrolase n=1 Tax=Actinocrinis sp. TaxID=1920516 RepID=UPI002DDCA506|nr:HAD-IA family hydrolase [Actinocrinis sp.]HEV2344497.1 HAD-IA family hydrolase [Actinocrinis sp.]